MNESVTITMKDIARELNVSVATVSRALKDSPRISEEQRERIKTFAREHNYYPNMLAENLRHSRVSPPKVIGVIMPQIAHYYFSTILSGIEEQASVRGYPAAFDGSLAGALRSSTRSSDERGVSLAVDYKKFTFTADVAVHPSKGTGQCKAVLKYAPQVTDHLSLAFRAVSRYRPQDTWPWRSELRAEAVLAASGGLSLKGCASFCKSEGFAWLACLEPGYSLETESLRWAVYLRGTAFVVDSWDDRIYIYERDIQGAFSVPAYYGRGCSLSAVTSLKIKRFTLGARAYATAYPGMAGKKPGKAGLKLQCMFTF